MTNNLESKMKIIGKDIKGYELYQHQAENISLEDLQNLQNYNVHLGKALWLIQHYDSVMNPKNEKGKEIIDRTKDRIDYCFKEESKGSPKNNYVEARKIFDSIYTNQTACQIA